jgi:repressor of nif and glnA expression
VPPEDPTDEVPEAKEPPELVSAAAFRRAIIQVLGESTEPMTERQITRAVAAMLPAVDKPPVTQHLEALKENGYVERAGASSRLVLTDRGTRFWRGIRVLTAAGG